MAVSSIGSRHGFGKNASVVSLLMSPNFCYRIGLVPEGKAIQPLSDFALASRLSYFLWSSQPDAQLRALAASGTLLEPNVLIAQTRRMMQEAQSKGFAASNPSRALSENRKVLRNLSVYDEDTRALLSGELELVPTRAEDFLEALLLQKLHSLLTIDSINLAVARRLGLTEMATADKSFDNVQGLIAYKPDDLA